MGDGLAEDSDGHLAHRVSQLEQQQSALSARQAAMEERLDRLQSTVSEARAEAKSDSEKVYSAINALRDDVNQRHGATSALRWAAGTAVAVAAAVAAWLRGFGV